VSGPASRFPQPPQSPPSPPPAAPEKQMSETVLSTCGPLGSFDMSYENVRQLGGGCDRSKYEMLMGLHFQECEYVHESIPGETCPDLAPTCRGIQSVSTCVVKDNQLFFGECTTTKTDVIKLVGRAPIVHSPTFQLAVSTFCCMFAKSYTQWVVWVQFGCRFTVKTRLPSFQNVVRLS